MNELTQRKGAQLSGKAMAKAKDKRRVVVDLEGADLKRFEDFQAQFGIKTDSQAARSLIHLALEQKRLRQATG